MFHNGMMFNAECHTAGVYIIIPQLTFRCYLLDLHEEHLHEVLSEKRE